MTQAEISGVLLLDKPEGRSSNAVLQLVKRLLCVAKAGHIGTLDPMATGLLFLCLGEATKFSRFLTEKEKSYCAILKLGQVTSTGDREGEIVQRHPVKITEAQVHEVLSQFVGIVQQEPPMYSALKYRGKRLYEYARKGLTVERKPRFVQIFKLDLVELEHDTLEITVTCSKGTYIRSLAEDLGRFLGCGAHLSSLRRTRTGPFHVDQSRRPEHLMAMTQQQRLDCILPVSNLLADLPDLVLNQNQIRNLYYGQCVDLGAESAPGLRRLYDSHYVFVGLGELDSNHNLSPKRLMAAD